MRVVSNEKLISSRSKIGFWSSLISPVILMMSASTIFTNPDALVTSLVLFVVGIIGFVLGVSFRKYGRGTDLEFNQILKKLGNDYSIFHFASPVSHLLAGPAGIWILIPKYARGTVTYSDKSKSWRLRRDRLLAKIFFFLTEGIGNPARDILGEADALDRYLRKRWELEETPHVQAAVVFMHDETVVDAGDAPIPTLHASKLRAFLREQEKNNQMPKNVIKAFKQLFEEEEG
jgi:hypothetical protein